MDLTLRLHFDVLVNTIFPKNFMCVGNVYIKNYYFIVVRRLLKCSIVGFYNDLYILETTKHIMPIIHLIKDYSIDWSKKIGTFFVIPF